MKTKTITVSVDEETEERFRKVAGAVYGKRKGYLGKAITEAMDGWEKREQGSDVNARAIATLEKGFDMGGLKTRNRDEWHER